MQQSDFLRKIEDIIPSNTTLVSELSEILNVSHDSAYRRLRGSTQLTISEVSALCKHYNISFDVFNDEDLENVTFSMLKMDYSIEKFEKYLANMLKDLNLIKSAKKNNIIYACEDIPIFYNYKYPTLGSYKMFYWMEAILNTDNLGSKKFNKDIIPDKLLDIGKQIYEAYIETPSIEIWTETTYLSVLKQIDFFWESGKFESKEDVIQVIDELKQLLHDIKLQAEVGKKLSSNTIESGQKADYQLFFSDIEIGNNCVLVDLGVTKSVYMGHMSFNTIATMNKKYCELTEAWLNNLIKKSTPVSMVSEKTRYQYFKTAFQKIDDFKAKINK
ncbi:MAG: hypothetical protein KAG84_00180 [Bacteroidales bacterium]|nr:hypothetical protein [Bacteroidales bacterium]